MLRRTVLATSLVVGLIASSSASAQEMDPVSQATFDTVMAFMGAMGSGDAETMSALMADDMVWHNEWYHDKFRCGNRRIHVCLAGKSQRRESRALELVRRQLCSQQSVSRKIGTWFGPSNFTGV